MPEDIVKKVFDAASERWDIGTEQEFRKDILDPKKRQILYDSLSTYYDLPKKDQFDLDLGVLNETAEKKEPSPLIKIGGNAVDSIRKFASNLFKDSNESEAKKEQKIRVVKSAEKPKPFPYRPTTKGVELKEKTAEEYRAENDKRASEIAYQYEKRDSIFKSMMNR